jgi:integrase
MAWIIERERDFLVRWRDAETGKTKSRSVRWNVETHSADPATADGEITREEARAWAESLAERKRQTERAYRKPLERVIKWNAEDYPEWNPSLDFVGQGEEELRFQNYVRSMVENAKMLRPTTRELYMRNIRHHIEGTALGHKNIRFIEQADVEHYWRNLDLGVGALRNVAALIRKAFNTAKRQGLIDISPLERADIRIPSRRVRSGGEPEPLTVDELERLAAGATRERDRLIILVMGYAGLRAGEVGGLRLRDIDFERCRFRLRQQVIRAGTAKSIAPLKTEASKRTIDVACSVTSVLKGFVEANMPATDGRVFHEANDGLLAHQGINNAVQRAARQAGLRPVNSHLLRHTAVSLLIDDGANPKAIQAFVGHSNIRETMDTYGHPFDYGGAALAAMERRREQYRNGIAS